MAVQSVTRTVAQQIRAVQVSAADSAAIYTLFPAIKPKYRCTTAVDEVYDPQGGTRITISRDEYPDQFAYPGDWILVLNADHSFNSQTGVHTWTTSASTEVQVWGQSAGLPGTAAEFGTTFTSQ